MLFMQIPDCFPHSSTTICKLHKKTPVSKKLSTYKLLQQLLRFMAVSSNASKYSYSICWLSLKNYLLCMNGIDIIIFCSTGKLKGLSNIFEHSRTFCLINLPKLRANLIKKFVFDCRAFC